MNYSLDSRAQNYIDPTGTYIMISETHKKGGEVYGYTGRMQIALIDEKKVIITFNINKGAQATIWVVLLIRWIIMETRWFGILNLKQVQIVR